MKSFIGMLGILFMSFSALALPKASDFEEVKESGPEAVVSKEEEATKTPLGENEEILLGTVRVIRKIEMTEVFFKDLKDSYYIPSGSKYSSIYKALDQSLKKGTAVSFKVNTKSRRVLSLESAPPKTSSPSGGSK